jgi:8-oxo-dGTP pyrophosphatase MutT (NUDIX family)
VPEPDEGVAGGAALGHRAIVNALAGFLLVLLASAVAGASERPPCPAQSTAGEEPAANAGCLVRIGERMLVIRHLRGGKLGLPGGRPAAGETPACTAHRETWEETGLDVRVGPLLRVLANGFRIFSCEAPPGTGALPIALPPQARNEVTAIEWRRADELDPADWRFPTWFEETRALAFPAGGVRDAASSGSLR